MYVGAQIWHGSAPASGSRWASARLSSQETCSSRRSSFYPATFELIRKLNVIKVGRAKEPPKRKRQWLRQCRGEQQDWWCYWDVPFAAKFVRTIDTHALQTRGSLAGTSPVPVLLGSPPGEVRPGGMRRAECGDWDGAVVSAPSRMARYQNWIGAVSGTRSAHWFWSEEPEQLVYSCDYTVIYVGTFCE
ncbi:hypothetical protein FB451DRAFT_1190874 [Mycena latifolia]|nr:hypothetical protein FB451DRAFT_1190874 [Mycena latifolia]